MNSLAVNIPNSLEQLTPQQYEQIKAMVAIDNLKQEYREDQKRASFDLDEKLSQWLSNKSKHTSRMYRTYIAEFVKFLNGKSMLNVTTLIVDEFIVNHLNKYSYSKARLVFASLSSFYSNLYRWGDIEKNPFRGGKLSLVKNEEEKEIPTSDDLDYLDMVYSSNSLKDRKMRLALHIMRTYGVRVGFFNTKYLSYNGVSLSSVSKGKLYPLNVKDDKFIRNNASLLTKLHSGTIANNFNSSVKKLYEEGIISCKFSPHAIRHYFACKEYTKDKDIYRVSRLLKHSSILITTNYLRGLKIKVKGENM